MQMYQIRSSRAFFPLFLEQLIYSLPEESHFPHYDVAAATIFRPFSL